MFVLVQNGSIASFVQSIPSSSDFFPNISNMDRLDSDTLLQLGWFPLTQVGADFDRTQFTQGESTYEFLSDRVVQTITIVPIDTTVLLQAAKATKITEINNWHTSVFTSGYLSPTLGYLIPCTSASLTSLQNSYTNMLNNNLESLVLINFTGVAVTITANQASSVLTELIEYLDYVVKNNAALLANVNSAVTLSNVNTIVATLGAYPVPELSLTATKTQAISDVKAMRKQTLDLYQKRSTGISRIYLDNITAATRLMNSDATVMSTGQTPTDYLAGLGSQIGMNATQFAIYVINENLRLGAPGQVIPSAYDIEKHYLLSSTQISLATSIDVVHAVVATYKAYCNPVTGN